MVETRAQRLARQRQKLHDNNNPTRRQKSSPEAPSLSPRRRKRQNEGTNLPSCHDAKTEPNQSKSRSKRDIDDPVAFWAREACWPPEYLKSNIQIQHGIKLKRPFRALRRISQSIKSSSFLYCPHSDDRKPGPTTQYQDPRFAFLLETKGVFMMDSPDGITDDDKKTSMALLTAEQTLPAKSIFGNDVFQQTRQMLQSVNEMRIFRDISPLMFPSPEILALNGTTALKCLIESLSRWWENAIPLTDDLMCPQPDFCVEFRRSAFTTWQMDKLSPFLGDFLRGDQSVFMATYDMYFPFFTGEVKSAMASLSVADCQNAHSMVLAARGIVELIRLVRREHELHRKVLCFSISHNDQEVRIFGYYPIIDGEETKYHHYSIKTFYFTKPSERWTAYRFTRNVYERWMPEHLKRICSAIEQLPDDQLSETPNDVE